MTTNTREEIIAGITKLLTNIAEDTPKAETAHNTSPPDTVEMLTIKECCGAIKGLTDYTMRQLVSRGEIPFVRCGKGKRGKTGCFEVLARARHDVAH